MISIDPIHIQKKFCDNIIYITQKKKMNLRLLLSLFRFRDFYCLINMLNVKMCNKYNWQTYGSSYNNLLTTVGSLVQTS